MDGFALKKILSLLVHPIPGLLIPILFVLVFCRKRSRFRQIILFTCPLLLLALSSPVVSNLIVSMLEDQHPILQTAPEDTAFIVVLGFGHHYREDLPANSVLTSVALSRLTEGVRLWKTKPNTLLVVGGAEFGNAISHAQAMENAAIAMGVEPDRIVRFDAARDTSDEISSSVELLQSKSLSEEGGGLRLVVVSSATHLTRTALMLKQAGAVYSLAPADFLMTHSSWYQFGVFSLVASNRAIHEWIGMLWHYISSSVRSSVSP